MVVDHDTGRLVWAAAGHDKKTLGQFFDLLGEERCAQIRLVSADALEWIGDMLRDRCKRVTLCIDAFHVVKWATEALDDSRPPTAGTEPPTCSRPTGPGCTWPTRSATTGATGG